MQAYDIDITVGDVWLRGSVEIDASWDVYTETVEHCGPYRRTETTTELVTLDSIHIVDLDIECGATMGDYESWLQEDSPEARVWEHHLNQVIQGGGKAYADLVASLEYSITENYDVSEAA